MVINEVWTNSKFPSRPAGKGNVIDVHNSCSCKNKCVGVVECHDDKHHHSYENEGLRLVVVMGTVTCVLHQVSCGLTITYTHTHILSLSFSSSSLLSHLEQCFRNVL